MMGITDSIRRLLKKQGSQPTNPTMYLADHSPRCISGFRLESIQADGMRFDGHPSQSDFVSAGLTDAEVSAPEYLNPVYALGCHCGQDLHSIHGFRWVNPDFNNAVAILSPLSLECTSCQTKNLLFDSDVHGYDAELGHGSSTVRKEGEPLVVCCDSCGSDEMEVFVRFEYPDDLWDDSVPEFREKQHDLFTWFTLFAKCSECSEWIDVTDFECA